MRKIIPFGAAVALTVLAVVTWFNRETSFQASNQGVGCIERIDQPVGIDEERAGPAESPIRRSVLTNSRPSPNYQAFATPAS
jgi:hypothetical protein